MALDPPKRPTRANGLLADVAASVSARVAKRVADTPKMAEGWVWSTVDGAVEVRADDVIVRLSGAVVHAGSISCTCLLAPRCVHLLAVVTALADPADDVPAPAALARTEPPTVDPADPAAATRSGCPPDPADAADGPRPGPAETPAFRALQDLLRLGAHGADIVVRAGLTRVAYDARADGQHRLGRALTRVVRDLRLLEADHPAFSLPGLVEDALEAMVVARGLAVAPSAALLGEARRTYRPVGTLRLWGLLAEPVLAGTGQAGVVTWLVDARGNTWNVPDVRPRPLGQAIGVYDVAPPLGALPHRKLCREGLFVQGATAADGRLGAGADVAAVRASGAAWTATPLGELWASPGSGELRFGRGTVLGLWRDGLMMHTEAGQLLLLPGSEHRSLPWRENLDLLGRAPGLELRLVGRPVDSRPRTWTGLAIAGDALHLPADWAGRVNLGLDRLTTAHVPTTVPDPVRLQGEAELGRDALAPLRRRVERAILGGTASLPGVGVGGVLADVASLERATAPAAAHLLAALSNAALGSQVGAGFSEAWLAGAVYLQAADRARAGS